MHERIAEAVVAGAGRGFEERGCEVARCSAACRAGGGAGGVEGVRGCGDGGQGVEEGGRVLKEERDGVAGLEGGVGEEGLEKFGTGGGREVVGEAGVEGGGERAG